MGATTRTSQKVRCQCCSLVTMAKIEGRMLVIKDKQHGEHHVLTIPMTEQQLLDLRPYVDTE